VKSEAAAALRGVVVETPLIPLPARPDRAAGSGAAEVLLKAESLQYTGAFKFRGAYWRCCQLTAGERAAGVVAHSSGNFAQGVAAAARALGVPATIVMPADAPVIDRIHETAQERGGTYESVITAVVTSDLVQMIRTETN
jgi:threonine dehydratase